MKSAQEILKEPYARIVIPTEDGGFHAEVLKNSRAALRKVTRPPRHIQI